MGGSYGRLLPVLLVIGIVALALFGCIQQQAGTSGASNASGGAHGFGDDVESLNVRIAAATTSSPIASLGSEVAALESKARNGSQYSGYLPLLEAQNLTLDVLDAYAEFRSEGAVLGTSGVDCGKNYSSFIADLRAANASAATATSEAASWQSAHASSTANLLVTAINNTDPAGMAVYAGLLEDEINLDCPKVEKPGKNYSLPLSFNDALEVANGVAGYGYFIYGSNETLDSGSVVTAVRTRGDFNITLNSSAWFFFLDSQPLAPFTHPVKYVIVDAASGTYMVLDEESYPRIDGLPRWKSIDERSDPANVLYPENASRFLSEPANLSTQTFRFTAGPYPMAGPSLNSLNAGADADKPLECCPSKRKYALVVTGSNDSMFRADTERMYDFLKGSGYSDDEITFLTTMSDVAGSDGITSVRTFYDALSRLMTNSDCCDSIFIYMAGHGGLDPVSLYKNKKTGEQKWIRKLADLGASPADWTYTGRKGNFHKIDINDATPDGDYVSSEIIGNAVYAMRSCNITIMYQSCHAGAAAPTLAKPGIKVLTPVDEDHSAYGNSKRSGGWGIGSVFTQAYFKAFGSGMGQADTNHDGTVSTKEAFDYANKANHDDVESDRQRYQHNADEATDPSVKAWWKSQADDLEPQNGVYMDGGPCTCCNVNCTISTGWKCTVIAGRNLPNCADCKGRKIGDTCRNETTSIVLPPINITIEPPLISGNETGNEAGNHTGGNATAGNNGTAAAPVCGDGTVTPPEECDPGNTYTDVCYGDKTCSSCKCYDPDRVPEATHMACSGSYCVSVPGEGPDSCSTDSQCTQTAPTHKICSGTNCVSVSGAGSDECSSDSQCTQIAPTHKTCSGSRCVSVSGSGSDQCSSDAQCTQAPAPYCGDGTINGNEQCDPQANPSGCSSGSACESNCRCVAPPSLNCEYICSLTSGATFIAANLSSESTCSAAATSHFPSRTCFTTCRYSWLYTAYNIAGEASCCCAMKKEFACTDCPGENPVCPASGTICPANAPSWHSPP